MAERNVFLGQLQQQLGAWADWVRQLDDQASSTAAQVRADAKVAYTQRAEKVRELIRQGRVQWERVSAATDDAWQGISDGAERSWSALQDAAAGLAMQTLPVATALQPAVESTTAKPHRKAHARSAGKQAADPKKKAAGPKKKAKAVKRSAKQATRRKSRGKKVAAKKRSVAAKSSRARAKSVKRTRAARKPARKK